MFTIKSREVSNMEDMLDSRDIEKRICELEGEREALREEIETAEGELQDAQEDNGDADAAADTLAFARRALTDWDEDNGDELQSLTALRKEVQEVSADWHYGATLIHESHFTAYAEQLAEDIGAIDRNTKWPNNHIDWDAAAEELMQDYTEVDFDGETYYVR
jgi:hypothetical protein